MVVKINGLYSHVAWSDAPDGSVDFSLDEDDDASYIGHITSLSGEEITDPLRYTWTENTQQEEDESDSAEDDGLAEQVALNTTDNRGTQASSDTGIGNDNELYSTNAGTDGWKWDESKILAESVVIDPYDAGKPVNGIKLTAKSYPGKVSFECGSFVSRLEAIDASDIGSHTYTISLDVMMSSVFSVTSPSVISGDSTLLSFEDLEPDSMYEDIPMDGAWYHYTSTAQAIAEDAGAGGALCFDLSNMPSGSVLEIANLKLEAGANATPWKRSAAEAKEAADAANTAASKAQSTADSANTAAGNAQSTADGAATAAGKAQSTAESASTAAITAQSMAIDAAKQATDYLVNINGGVLVAKKGNTVGALVSADGDFEVVPLTWADGKAEIGTALAKFDQDSILLGSTSKYPNIRLGDEHSSIYADKDESNNFMHLMSENGNGYSHIAEAVANGGTRSVIDIRAQSDNAKAESACIELVSDATDGNYVAVTADTTYFGTGTVEAATVKATTFTGDLDGNAKTATKVNGHTVNSDVPSGAKFTDTVYDDSSVRSLIAGKQDKVTPATFTATAYIDGYLTNASKGLRFTIPYCPAIYGTPSSITASIKIRQNGKYIYGSASLSITITIGSDSFSVSPLGVSVVYDLSTALSGATNNDLIAIDGRFTFNY